MERNLLKDGAKAKLCDNAIMEYEKNDWARRLSEEDLEANVKLVHYLPHHGIYRPEKKSNPLRIHVLLEICLELCFALEKNLLPSWGSSRRCTYKLS